MVPEEAPPSVSDQLPMEVRSPSLLAPVQQMVQLIT
jgi:hypothetical protein